MNIAVVDDDAAENDALCTALNDWCSQNRTAARVCAFPSADAFLKGLAPGLWDLVFLDVYMPGTSGMEAAARLRALDEKCLIVFCTTSADSAVQSYRVRAFDYLLKPLCPGQVAEVMALACAALHNRSAYIEVKEGWSMVRIPLRDIIYTDYYNHYIHIHTRQRVIKTHLPFAEFSPLLLCFPQFLCCYRNCIVNMDAVRSLEPADFVMENGERVPIARAQRAALRQQYADYAFDKLEKGGNS